jgi:TetR/AcrR family transcriptional repressor of nem operon
MPRGLNKEAILEAGLALMYDRGFHASGIQEIANASGVPKGSFYNHFKSKEDFAVQALERYTERAAAHLQATLIEGQGSPIERLRRVLDDWSENQFSTNRGRGCFAANLSMEIANHSPIIREALGKSLTKLESFFQSCLKEAKASGEIGPEVDVRPLASFLYDALHGSFMRAKAEGKTEPATRFRDFVFTTLLAR